MKKAFWKADWLLGLIVALAPLSASGSELVQGFDRLAYDWGVRASSHAPHIFHDASVGRALHHPDAAVPDGGNGVRRECGAAYRTRCDPLRVDGRQINAGPVERGSPRYQTGQHHV